MSPCPYKAEIKEIVSVLGYIEDKEQSITAVVHYLFRVFLNLSCKSYM